MTPSISIAMATYNGAKYLREQLDSLAGQTYLPCELVVGDDGSTDDTMAILEEFSRRAPFPMRIIRNAENLGFGDNFLKTASECSGDWIAFCDQDDVWLPQKLERCTHAIRNDPSLNLVLQNAELCDESLSPRGRLFPNSYRPGIYAAGQLFGLWVWHGFLQTVRSALIKEVPFADRPPDLTRGRPVRSHDQWICTLANAIGGICVLAGSAALYRRHESTITSSYPARNARQRIDDAIRTGAMHYCIQSKRAIATAVVLRRIGGTDNHSWTSMLASNALLFDRLSKVQETRARLYESDGIVGRLRLFTSLWRMGGYTGPRFFALGWRSAVKDGVVMLVGGGRQSAPTPEDGALPPDFHACSIKPPWPQVK